MPTTPPTLPAYSGPSATLYPSAVTQRSISGAQVAWSDPDRLVGAADTSSATVTVPDPASYPTTMTDTLNLDFSPPSGQESSFILGWNYTYKGLAAAPTDASAWSKGRIGFTLTARDGGDAAIGQPESYHEYEGDGVAQDFTASDEYPSGADAAGPDYISIFSSGPTTSASLGTRAGTFADWLGLTFAVRYVYPSPLGYASNLALDALAVTVYYTPASGADHTTPLTVATTPGITAINAATAGIALDGSWGPEIAWANPGACTTLKSATAATVASGVWNNTTKTLTKTNLAINLPSVGDTEVFTVSGGTGWTVGAEFRATKVNNSVVTLTNLDGSAINNANTSVSGTMGLAAVATSDPSDLCGQTEFLRIPFEAGSLAADLYRAPRQLRLPIRIAFSDALSGLGTVPDFCAVGRAAIVKDDNTVVLSDAAIMLYDAANFKIGSYGSAQPRDRVLALDVSGLTPDQVGTLNGGKFAALVRFKVSEHLNTDFYESGIVSVLGINGATWESDDLAAPTITPAATTIETQTAAGLVVSLPDSYATHIRVGAIPSGTLYKSDGTTQINSNSFITKAEGAAGLKFTPGSTPGIVRIPMKSAAGASDDAAGGAEGFAPIAVFDALGQAGSGGTSSGALLGLL